MADFAPLIAGLGAIKDLLPALITERDRQKAAAIELQFSEKLAHVHFQLLQVIQAASEQAEALRVARERIGQLEADQREPHRHQLVELPDCRWAYGYVLRRVGEPGAVSDEPPHFLCQPCLDSRRKVVLIATTLYGSRVWACPACNWAATGQQVADD